MEVSDCHLLIEKPHETLQRDNPVCSADLRGLIFYEGQRDGDLAHCLTVSLYLTLSFSDWVSRSAGLIQGVILGRQR